MHVNSQLLFKSYAVPYFKPGCRVLEIGPEKKISAFRSLAGGAVCQWETLDLSGEKGPTFVSRHEYEFPIPDGTYDIVLSGQVIEHVKKIWVWIKEVARVCKAGGLVITLNPASWPYHECPVDAWRIFPAGMKALYEEAGLEVLQCVCENLQLFEKAPSARRLPIDTLKTDLVSAGRYRRLFAGMGETCPSWKLRLKQWLGWPVSMCFDTITIGRKGG